MSLNLFHDVIQCDFSGLEVGFKRIARESLGHAKPGGACSSDALPQHTSTINEGESGNL